MRNLFRFALIQATIVIKFTERLIKMLKWFEIRKAFDI